MKTIFVKPANGYVVRHPITYERIPDEGMTVQHDHYWLRRLAENAVVIADKEPAKEPQKQETKE